MRPLPPPVAVLPRRTARRLKWLDWVLAVQVLLVSFLVARLFLELEDTPLVRGAAGAYRVPGGLLAAAVAPVEDEAARPE